MELQKLLFHLIRCALTGQPLPDQTRDACTPEVLPGLYKLAKAHDLAHLAAAALDRNQLLSKDSPCYDQFRKEPVTALYRRQQMNSALEALSAALEEAQIPFVPLKGAVLWKLYPESWMRTSCDIDILVHPEDLDRAEACLATKCGYTRSGHCSHDISLTGPRGSHLELHFTLMEHDRLEHADRVLSTVWQRVIPADGCKYRMEMPDELFYFYHIAHLAKHFIFGGCGIRPLVDLWILDRQSQSTDVRDALLEEGGLLKFANIIRRLSLVWMEDAPAEPMDRDVELFILRGGVYGSISNQVAVQQQRHGGKFRYFMVRLFPPLKTMRMLFPVLEKHPWLLPLTWPVRWLRLTFGGRFRSSMHELRLNSQISKESTNETARFLQNLGL